MNTINRTPHKKYRKILLSLVTLTIGIILILQMFVIGQASSLSQINQIPTQPTEVPPLESDLSITQPEFSINANQLELATSDLKQTLYVYAKENTQIKTNFSLKAGTVYSIRASGLWVWGGCDSYYCPGGWPTYLRWGDAGYLSDDHFNSFSDPMWSSMIYLKINGVRANFGGYNDRHIYTMQLTGNGAQATFQIQDCSNCWGDNSGSIRIEIFEGLAQDALDVGAKAFLQRNQTNGAIYSTTWGWGGDVMQRLPTDKLYRCGKEATGNEVRFCTFGCLVTSWSMLIDRWGQPYNFHTSPRILNKWLCENEGYVNGSYLVPGKASEFVRKLSGRSFIEFNVWGTNETRIHNLIQAGYPVILGIPMGGGQHFILATGERMSGQTKTLFINDPGGCNLDVFTTPLTTRANNNYEQHKWGIELPSGSSLASISIGLASPAELVITDPNGLKTGVDPNKNTIYNDDPNASYFLDQIEPDDDTIPPSPGVKWFYTNAPVDGNYTIQVIGTGSGTYHLYIQGYDEMGEPSTTELTSQIEPGIMDSYRMEFSDTTGVAPELLQIVPVDIKPGSDPNSINCRNRNAVITVAILTTQDFNALNVDYTSVRFQNASELHVSKIAGVPIKHEEDVDLDGDIDLVFHFALKNTNLNCSSNIGEINGMLINGMKFFGLDAIRMVNP
jgi:hypothetical protein